MAYVKKVFENDKVRITVEQDEDCDSPRDMYDNFGHMICFHRNYVLGDKHEFENPRQFLENLAYAQVMKSEFMKEKIVSKTTKWYRDNSVPEEDWEEMLDDAFIESNFGELDDSDLMEVILIDHVILPLYLYDHSGISMSTGSFNDRWDSGQVGWTYATMEEIKNNWMLKNGEETSDEYTKAAEKLLEGEVRTYNSYLTGNVWGFKLEEKTETCETCSNNLECPKSCDIECSYGRNCGRLVPCSRKEDCEERWEYEETDSCWGFFGWDNDDDMYREMVPKEYWKEFGIEPKKVYYTAGQDVAK